MSDRGGGALPGLRDQRGQFSQFSQRDGIALALIFALALTVRMVFMRDWLNFDETQHYLIAESPFWSDFRLMANYGRQDRSFPNRPSGLNTDEYQQWGVGLSYAWWRANTVTVRWSEGRYVDTSDVSSPTDRLELALNLGPSIFGVTPPAERLQLESLERWRRGPDADRQNEDGVLFRFYSESASSVEVAGDFNGWGRNKHSLRALGNGWWELRVSLPPGRYQYVYMVDGVATTPPESTTTIDDGFGGRNGSLEVLR